MPTITIRAYVQIIATKKTGNVIVKPHLLVFDKQLGMDYKVPYTVKLLEKELTKWATEEASNRFIGQLKADRSLKREYGRVKWHAEVAGSAVTAHKTQEEANNFLRIITVLEPQTVAQHQEKFLTALDCTVLDLKNKYYHSQEATQDIAFALPT